MAPILSCAPAFVRGRRAPQALAEQLPELVPLVAVDTACALPMRLVKKCHEKWGSARSSAPT